MIICQCLPLPVHTVLLSSNWHNFFFLFHSGDGKCVICDSYVRPSTLVRICDECNYGSYQGRCVICGGPGVSDAYYCKECTIMEKDVSLTVNIAYKCLKGKAPEGILKIFQCCCFIPPRKKLEKQTSIFLY